MSQLPYDPRVPDGEEVVEGVPVLVDVREVSTPPTASLPAAQAAAAAATGFLAGAATLALLQRRSARRVPRPRSLPRRAVDMLPVAGTRTFLVEVHLLGKPAE